MNLISSLLVAELLTRIYSSNTPPGSDDDFAPVEKRAPAGRRGAASKQVKYSQSSDSEDGF